MLSKKITFLLVFLGAFLFAEAQTVKTPPASKKAAVTEYIGLTKVHVSYHRPGVKEREVYGENGLVPYNGGNPWPWRAGANENTVMYFGDAVTINGKALAAGKYGFHIIASPEEWTLIFSKNASAWGSYNYDAAEDALRVTAKPTDGEHVEWLRYQFVNQTDDSVDIELAWGKKRIQFTVATDVHAAAVASIEREIDGLLGFSWQGCNSAAQYFLTADKDYEIGLKYAERAADPNWGGQANFTTLSTQAQLLTKLGKAAEAEAVMDKALPMATKTELHFYGRSLIQAGKAKEALAIFEMNQKNHPDDNFTIFVGLARGNMAVENYKEAAMYFRKAAPNAPQGQQEAYEGLAKDCEAKM